MLAYATVLSHNKNPMSERLDIILEKIRAHDERPKIIGSFLLEDASLQVLIPKSVKDEMPGLEVPIRIPNILDHGTVQVMYGDLIASSLVQRKISIADWYEDQSARSTRSLFTPGTWFDVDWGQVGIDSLRSSDAYYKYLQSKNR
jgi:hypothetical protein